MQDKIEKQTMFINTNVGTRHTQNVKYRRGFKLKAVAFQTIS